MNWIKRLFKKKEKEFIKEKPQITEEKKEYAKRYCLLRDYVLPVCFSLQTYVVTKNQL